MTDLPPRERADGDRNTARESTSNYAAASWIDAAGGAPSAAGRGALSYITSCP